VKLSKVRLALTGIALTLALVACGGSSGSSGVTAGAYVKAACGTLATWKRDVTAAAAKLQTTSSAAKSLAQGKAEYVVFVTSLVEATRKASNGLKSAGTPNVKDGKQAATTLSQAFTRARTSSRRRSTPWPTPAPSATISCARQRPRTRSAGRSTPADRRHGAPGSNGGSGVQSLPGSDCGRGAILALLRLRAGCNPRRAQTAEVGAIFAEPRRGAR
jgi:hypothetical protein